MSNAWIIDAVRTPRGRGKRAKGDKPGGGLSEVHPQELMGQTLNRLADKAGFDKKTVDDVVLGTVSQAKEQGACIARNSLLAAFLKSLDLYDKMGEGVFIPDSLTWYVTVPAFLVFFVFWAFVAIWNEKSEKFVIF